MFKDVINLITVNSSINDLGDVVREKVKGPLVFANKKSIRQSEFYQAAATGLRPELMFEIRTVDYNQEEMLEFNNETYTIIRTYEKDSEFIELVCQGVVNNASS